MLDNKKNENEFDQVNNDYQSLIDTTQYDPNRNQQPFNQPSIPHEFTLDQQRIMDENRMRAMNRKRQREEEERKQLEPGSDKRISQNSKINLQTVEEVADLDVTEEDLAGFLDF